MTKDIKVRMNWLKGMYIYTPLFLEQEDSDWE